VVTWMRNWRNRANKNSSHVYNGQISYPQFVMSPESFISPNELNPYPFECDLNIRRYSIVKKISRKYLLLANKRLPIPTLMFSSAIFSLYLSIYYFSNPRKIELLYQLFITVDLAHRWKIISEYHLLFPPLLQIPIQQVWAVYRF